MFTLFYTVPEQTHLTNQYATLQRKAAKHGWNTTFREPNKKRSFIENQEWKPVYEKLCRGEGTKKYHVSNNFLFVLYTRYIII